MKTKRFWTRWWVYVIAAFVLLGGVLNLAGYRPAEKPAASPSVEASPTVAASESPDAGLGPAVEAALLEGFGVGSFAEACSASSWACAITTVESMPSGMVRVDVQETLSKDEAQDIGRHVLTLTCGQLPDLSVVVVRDASGVDRANVYRSGVVCA